MSRRCALQERDRAGRHHAPRLEASRLRSANMSFEFPPMPALAEAREDEAGRQAQEACPQAPGSVPSASNEAVALLPAFTTPGVVLGGGQADRAQLRKQRRRAGSMSWPSKCSMAWRGARTWQRIYGRSIAGGAELLRQLVDKLVERTLLARSSDVPPPKDELPEKVGQLESGGWPLSPLHQGRLPSVHPLRSGRRLMRSRSHRAPCLRRWRVRHGCRHIPAARGRRWIAGRDASRTAHLAALRRYRRSRWLISRPCSSSRGACTAGSRCPAWADCAQDLAVGRRAAQHRGVCSRTQGRGTRRGLYHYHPTRIGSDS